MEVPELVTLHLWRVPRRSVPVAASRMARDRPGLRRSPGITFTKLLGTGRGRTFGVTDADPRRWALLTCWAAAAAATEFEHSPTVTAWDGMASARLRLVLRPLSSRGRWSGKEPFGRPDVAACDGPVAALTRARLRPQRMVRFWRAVPPVAADLHRSPGLRLALGVGEFPIGLQGTFSLWDSAGALRDFAYRSPVHAKVVDRTPRERWYAEELFARFAVLAVDGELGEFAP